jgi:hypothetical protein
MKRIFIASLVGAAIAFLWGYVSWELLPWHHMRGFYNDNEVARVIKDNVSGHGVYMMPKRGKQGIDAEALTNGPVIYATVRPGKLDPPWTLSSHLIRSFAIQLAGALIIAVTVYRIRARRYLSRASIGTTMGLFAGLVMTLPSWNWLELPGYHALVRILDPLIGWTLVGLAVAAIVKPPRARRIFT